MVEWENHTMDVQMKNRQQLCDAIVPMWTQMRNVCGTLLNWCMKSWGNSEGKNGISNSAIKVLLINWALSVYKTWISDCSQSFSALNVGFSTLLEDKHQVSLSNKLSSGQLQGILFVIYTNKDRDRKKGRLAVLTELDYMYIQYDTRRSTSGSLSKAKSFRDGWRAEKRRNMTN